MLRLYFPKFDSTMVLSHDDEIFHYVVRVRRVKVGDLLEVFDGIGGVAQASVQSISAKKLILSLGELYHSPADLTVRIHAAMALLAQDKMDFAVQKCVELGASHLTPILTEYAQSVPQSAWAKRWQHWQKVIVSACEQCGRNRLPTLSPITYFDEFCQQMQTHHPLSVKGFAQRGGSHLMPWLSSHTPAITEHGLIFLVGAEGGLASDECARLISGGWQAIDLGARTLRAETATLKIVSVVQTMLGDG